MIANNRYKQVKRWCDGKTDSTQTIVHAKVKEGRFNIGPSKQETLERRRHDVEIASGATFFHDSTPPFVLGCLHDKQSTKTFEKNGKGTVVEANY